jgi:hypothetical protein
MNILLHRRIEEGSMTDVLKDAAAFGTLVFFVTVLGFWASAIPTLI